MLESLSNLTLGAILTALVLVACLMTWGVLTVSHRLQVAYINIAAQERGATLAR